MRKFTEKMIVFLFVAGFFAIAACSEDVMPTLPDESIERFDLDHKMDYTDGEEEDTTAGPRVVFLIPSNDGIKSVEMELSTIAV